MSGFKESVFFYIIVGLVVILCLRIYAKSDVYNLKCVIATVDGHKYCVRDREHIGDASNLMASAAGKCETLVNFLHKKHPDEPDIQRLKKNFDPRRISETLPTSELTAYSENKGEKIAFCLNRTKNSTTLIDLNTLTFVAIHELAHLMTSSIGHKQDFWQNFKFLLENAIKENIYTPVDYKKKPESYCGIMISDNPYYDM